MKSRFEIYDYTAIIFLVVFLCTVTSYLYCYWKSPHMDFIHIYTAGHMWRTGEGTGYYDFHLIEDASGFLIETPERFDAHAKTLGFEAPYAAPLFSYFPAFIPLFSLITYLPYFYAAKLNLVCSVFLLLLVLKKIIQTELPESWHIKIFLVASVSLFLSEPVAWAIGNGQITPYLFAGTWLSVYLQKKKPLWAGMLLATMASLKYFPGILVFSWLLQKNFKAVGSFGISIIMIFFTGVVLFGNTVIEEHLNLLQAFNTGVYLFPLNQSIDASIMRFYFPVARTLSSIAAPFFWDVSIISVCLKWGVLLSWCWFYRRIDSVSQISDKGSHSVNSRVSGYYLMCVSILLFPISWNHYYIFFIPLCCWVLSMYLAFGAMKLRSQVAFFIIAALLLFPPPVSWTYPLEIALRFLGVNTAEFLVKMFLSHNTIGGFMALTLAHFLLYKRSMVISNIPAAA